MNSEKTLNEVRGILVTAAQQYHTHGTSTLTDAEFDARKAELRAMSPDDPFLKLVGAPAPIDSHLKKAAHPEYIKMGSVANADQYGPTYLEGMTKWWEKLGRPKLVGVLKVDGMSIDLVYKDGIFVKAITRGDGLIGEDVTQNILKSRDLPVTVPAPDFTGCVRAEVVLFREDWAKVDPNLKDAELARNVGTGIARRKDGVNAEFLRILAHDLVSEPTADQSTSVEVMLGEQTTQRKMITLAKLGFKTPGIMFGPGMEEATEFHADVTERRRLDLIPYGIDGIVFTIDDQVELKKLGIDGESCWRGQIAWKFPAAVAVTTLNAVEWKTGHTGAVAPVAIMEPVLINGVSITNASLYNFDEISRLGLRIGDKVEISRRGDCIPKLERVIYQGFGELIKAPTSCPTCSSELTTKKNTDGSNSVAIYCLNPECDAKTTGKLRRWIKSVGIMEIGDEILEALTTEATNSEVLVKTIADLYTLKQYQNGFKWSLGSDLMVNGKKLGISRANKILAEIDKTRSLTIDQFLGSIGVDGLGKRRVQMIIDEDLKLGSNMLHDEVCHWFSHHQRKDTTVTNAYAGGRLVPYADDLGIPNMASRIQAGLDANRPLIEELLKHIRITAPEVKNTPAADAKLTGTSFCFSGVRPAEEEVARLTFLGATEKSGVGKGLTHLVLKDPASTSSKAVKAREMGMAVIGYDEFQKMIA